MEAAVVNISRCECAASQHKQVVLSTFVDTPLSGKRMEALDTQRVDSMKSKLRTEPKIPIIKASSASSGCSIHRVPHRFRQDNENSFEPKIISIGPFHHHKRGPHEEQKWRYIQAMEHHKWRYLHLILSRIGENCLDKFWAAAKISEKEARECYSEEFEDIDSDSFVEMMVLDGCFIIELFRRSWTKEFVDDPLIRLEWLKKHLAIDLLMLENQMPYFLLQTLFNLMNISCPCLAEMALGFFGFVFPTNKYTDHSSHKIQNLLHLVHVSLVPSSGEKKSLKPRDTMKMIPCASELQAVGFLFKKREANCSEGILGINFRLRFGVVYRGIIEIPPLMVSDVTGTLFLNLVAFEQCYRHVATDFSGYIVFLDCLVATVKDVGILCNHGIDNCFGSNQHLVDLVNKIGGKLIVDNVGFLDTFKQINEHYEGITNRRLRANFNRNYVKNPLAVISVFVGILSVLTAIVFQLLNLIRSFNK